MADYYNKGVALTHEEQLVKFNQRTGEIKEVKPPVNNIPTGQEKFTPDKYFVKNYTKAWNYLFENLSSIEIKIAIKMSTMAEFKTNSLSPLDDTTSIRHLADFFDIGVNSVKKSFKNLFKQGVYASFKYCHFERGNVEEWIFNPFISFKGSLIHSDLKELFINTKVAQAFRN